MSNLHFQIEQFCRDTLYAWWLRQTPTYMTKRRLCQINVSIMVVATILYFLEYLKYRRVAHTKTQEPFTWVPMYPCTTVCQKAWAIWIHVSTKQKLFSNLNYNTVLLKVEIFLRMLKFPLHRLYSRMSYESTYCANMKFLA